MHGYLRKRVQEVKFFQRNIFPKRYHIIDFTKALYYIKSSPDTNDCDKIRRIPFRDIKEAYMPGPNKE